MLRTRFVLLLLPRGSAAAAPTAAAHARVLPSFALGGNGSAGMDWHDYDLLRASGAATVHGYYGGGSGAAGAGGYHDEVGGKTPLLKADCKSGGSFTSRDLSGGQNRISSGDFHKLCLQNF